jgi:hypothetical protein
LHCEERFPHGVNASSRVGPIHSYSHFMNADHEQGPLTLGEFVMGVYAYGHINPKHIRVILRSPWFLERTRHAVQSAVAEG